MQLSFSLAAALFASDWAWVQGTSCDQAAIDAACAGWSVVQRTLCHNLEKAKCCIHGGASREACCTAADPMIQKLPLCKSAVGPSHMQCTEDIDAACQSCGGEAGDECAKCRGEEEVKCCRQRGGSMDLCCQDQRADIRAGPLCKPPLLGSSGASPCEPEAVEAECLGQGPLCTAEQAVRCCFRSQSHQQCCAAASSAVQARPLCATTSIFPGQGGSTPEAEPCTPAAVEATCESSSDAQNCRNEEYLQCCLDSPRGSQELCCRRHPEVQQSALCHINLASAARQLCSPQVLQPCLDCGLPTSNECRYCVEEAYVDCCINSGGPVDVCCEDASPSLRAKPLCQANAILFP